MLWPGVENVDEIRGQMADVCGRIGVQGLGPGSKTTVAQAPYVPAGELRGMIQGIPPPSPGDLDMLFGSVQND